MKSSKTYGNFRQRFVKNLFRYPIVALLSHWTLQGIFYMGWTERLYKIAIELILFFIFLAGFQYIFPIQVALLIAFLIAHTLNFLFNGQLWAVLKCFGFVQISDDKFSSYVKALGQRAKREKSIEALIAYGSLARKEYTSGSDLDARILRKPGFINAIRACTFLMFERTQALLNHFPLDMYVVDNSEALKKLRADEKGVSLID